MTNPHATATARGTSPGRPAPALQEVVSVLFVDSGVEGGGRQGRPPRARFECVRCQTTEGPVTGRDAVPTFVATVKDVHRARCAATPQEHRQ